jgi:5'-nucleotidase
MKNVVGILLAAYKSNSDYYCFYSGIRAEFDPDKGLLKKKVKKIDIVKPDGTTVNVDLSKKNKTLYSITANSYMLQFIGIIKKKSFGLINVVPKDAKGEKVTDMTKAVIDMDEKLPGVQEGKEWLALMEYLGQMKDVDNNGIPDVEKKYSETIQTMMRVK